MCKNPTLLLHLRAVFSIIARKCPSVPAPGPAQPGRAVPYTIDNERTETTVSAEKKSQAKAERDEKRRQEEQKNRRSMAIYTVVAVVVVVAAVAAMFWRSGVLQRSLTALDVNGEKYTSVDLQYYYNSIYSQQARAYAFNTDESVKKQVFDESTGQTWHDHLMELAVEQLTRNSALAWQARDEGYTLSADAQSAISSTLAQLETSWINYNMTSRDAFIRANFGSYMTYDRLVELINLEFTASDYAQSKLDAIEHSDADYDAYYQEHADQMDTVVFSQLAFRCTLPTSDENGDPIERTAEEEAAALEELKPAQKALAEEVLAKLEAREDMTYLIEEYGDQAYTFSNVSRATYAELASFPYADWLIDSARKPGDATIIENGFDTAYYYYVIRFEDRELDQEQTHDVRHLLVRAGESSVNPDPTQEEYDEAEQKAQALLDEWKAGEATEESFAILATQNSDDTGSAQNGGLISDITSTSGYVEAFRDWALDPVRKPGDTELVKTEYGWHIMYYVSTNEPLWRQNTANALRQQDYENLADSASQGWPITRGPGMSLIVAS